MIVRKKSLIMEAFTRTSKTQFSHIGRIFFIIIFVFSLMGTSPVLNVQAATTITFTAGELLGKPTSSSIAINVVPAETIELKYQYGTASGAYNNETSPVTATGGAPSEVVLEGLSPNTTYYYRMQYHKPGETDWVNRMEYSFTTQRAEGSTFTFTVTSDAHGGSFQSVANNINNEHPDFDIDLGDTFMADSATSQSAVNAKYLTYRGSSYFGGFGTSVPIFLSSGNHEDEEGWNLDDTPFSTALANIQARKLYFPTPINDGVFYSGNTDPLSAIDAAAYGDQFREDYYAWTWGDALFVVIDPFQYTMNLPYSGGPNEGTDDSVTGNQWSWTLGQQQYNWFKTTLENSDAKYKFVFSHQMVGGIPNTAVSGIGPGYVRGGAGASAYFEWGGKNSDGSEGFGANRDPVNFGTTPLHQLMVANGVSAYFHGHDHQYVYEKTDDGIVYQEVPGPNSATNAFSGIYTEGDHDTYNTIKKLSNAGHLKVTVTSTEATVDYIFTSGTSNYAYTIAPAEDDETPPSVTINQASTQSDPTSAATINYTVVFSKSVTDFVTGDVTLSGTAGATTAVVTGSGTTYNVAVSGMTGSGTVIAEIAAGVAQDSASNPNYASTSTDNTVTYNLSTSATVTLDGAVSTGTGATSVSSLSFSHTTGAGTNRLLLVGVSWNCNNTARTISSITFTYGSNVLNLSQRILQETSSTTRRYAAIWYSPTEPPQNTVGTVAITFSGTVSNGIIAGAANFAGVDQTTPFTVSNGANSASTGTTQTVTLNLLNGNELVFDTVFIGGNPPDDPTVGADQTRLWTGTTSNTRGVASIEQATGNSVTMSWTTASASAWASAAVAINPASTAAGYTLAVTSANGTVTKNPDKTTYSAGETVQLTAAPASGYYFNNWTGSISSTDNPVSITMDGNKSVIANYVSSTTTFTGTELLGRPEANSIAVSVVPNTAILLRYQYGTTSGTYTNTTTAVSASAGVPQVVTLDGLTANTKYYYRLQYSTNGGRDWTSRSENTFWTQRASGSTFSFTITSDSHINIALGNTTTWTNTLNDVKDDAADFEIDLGDTVAMDNGTNSVAIGDTAAVEQVYKDVLPYFNIISGSSPLFMIAGNHEQQEAWHQLPPVASSLPIMGKNAEKKFFLNPVPDTFYSGDTGTDTNLSGDHLRQAYYAWTWGDALFVVINPFWFTTTKPYTTSVGGGEGDTTGSGNRWDWTLGQDQFNWLKSTLEGSSAKYKFIFSHQIVGGNSWTSPDMVNYGHGGVDSANLVEWGGYNVGGTIWGWNTQRSGWGNQTIHQMMVANGVTAFFHGHDHQFAYEKMDGIVYQSVPSDGFTTNFGIYQDGGNDGKTIKAIDGSGHLLVTVGPTASTVDLIQTGASSPAYSYSMTPVVNDAPVVTDIPNLTIAEGASFAAISLDNYVSDPDNTDAELTWTYSGNTELGVSITNRVATITVPNENWNGTETITFRATDPDGLYDEDAATFTVTGVNDAPVITGQKPLTTLEDTALLLAVSDLTITDPDSSSFTLSVAGGANYTVSGTTITPALNFNGTLTVPVTVNDGQAASSPYNLSVTVTAVNDAPVAVAQSITTNKNTAKIITLMGTDVDSGSLTYDIETQPANGDLTGTAPNMTYTPDTGYVGEDGFTFTVSDGALISAPATISIEVTDVSVPTLPSSFHGEIHINDNPPAVGDTLQAFLPELTTAASSTTITTNGGMLTYTFNVPAGSKGSGTEGETITFKIGSRTVGTAIWHSGTNVLLNFHPPAALPGSAYYGVEGSAITFSGSANDWGTDAATYQWDWENDGIYDNTGPSTTHTWAADGSYTVGLKVTDAQGGVGTATVAVNVNNAAPVLAAIGTQSVDELANLTFTATATDNDLPLTFSLVGAPSTASITSGGVFSWTPTEADGPNSYPFTVKVCDAAASPLCAEQSVTVTVNEVNVAPVLNAIGNKSVNEGTALSFTATASDVDLPANTLTFSLVNAPSGASITAGGSFSWTPTEAQGPMAPTFDVCVSDSKASTCETITVTVVEVNAAPVLNAIGNKSVDEKSLLSFTATANDTDIPANTLTFSLANGTGGSVPSGASITAAGAFSWTPDETQGGSNYTFDVCVSDNTASACETITVTVNEVSLTHSISLAAGWNLVSFNLHPADTAIAAVLSSIAGNYDLVYAWDATGAHASAGNWMKYSPSSPSYSNTLTALDETMGFWVHTTAADTLEVNGTSAASTNIPLNTAAGGWNLVGYPSVSTQTLPGVLVNHGVGTDFTLIYAYHPLDTTDPWKLFDRTAVEYSNDLKSMAPGWGHWVYATANHTWDVTYNVP